MLDQNQLHSIEARCTQEAAPRCTNACPLGLDVRGFLMNIANDKPKEARKILERYLPLATIICQVCDHPCGDACVRRDLGGTLAISELEQFILAEIPRQMRPIVRPAKAQKVAILGAGLASYFVAADLANKGFASTIFHQDAKDTALLTAFPNLAKIQDAMLDEFSFLAKMHLEFCQAEINLVLLEQVAKDYAAIFIDASCCDFAPERENIDSQTLFWRDNICVGGWQNLSPTGAKYHLASSQISDARCAALSLHRILTSASLDASRKEDRTNRLHTNLTGIKPVAPVVPSNQIWTMAEAQQEAKRCINCSCLQCLETCPFLKKYGEFPRIYARKIFGNATIVRGNRTSNALVTGCALCGQCAEVCPEHFSMAEVCLAARQDAVEREVMPASAHEFAMEDFAQATSQESAFYLVDNAKIADNTKINEKTNDVDRYLLFPGCQLLATRSEQVLDLYQWLKESLNKEGKNLDLFANCCGIPAHWAGREAVFATHAENLKAIWEKQKAKILIACASCREALIKILPEAEIISLWQFIEALLPSNFASQVENVPSKMHIQDPCGARHDQIWQQAVRSLAKKAGITICELERNKNKTACCGYGGLVWNAQPDLANAMRDSRSQEFSLPVLSSCIMCRERFATQAQSWHILDILPPTNAKRQVEQGYISLSARRAGRVALKKKILREFKQDGNILDLPQANLPNIAQTSGELAKIQVKMAPEVMQILEKRFILMQDIYTALIGIESTGAKFYNNENGHFLGSWRPRNVTFWVEYSLDQSQVTDKSEAQVAGQYSSFILHDAWVHRMVVSGATQPAAEVDLPERVHA